MTSSSIEKPILDSYSTPLQNIGKIKIFKGNKVNFAVAEAAIKRINTHVDWSHDNEKILEILKSSPKYCFFLAEGSEIQGYAVVREQDPTHHDHNLHISWIATDVLNKGVGTALMLKIIDKNKKLGNKLLTLSHRKKANLTNFYKKIANQAHVNYQCEEKEPLFFHVTYTM